MRRWTPLGAYICQVRRRTRRLFCLRPAGFEARLVLPEALEVIRRECGVALSALIDR
jgi:hypothetical protein